MQSLMLLVLVAVVAGLVQGECMVETEVDNNFLVTKLVSSTAVYWRNHHLILNGISALMISDACVSYLRSD